MRFAGIWKWRRVCEGSGRQQSITEVDKLTEPAQKDSQVNVRIRPNESKENTVGFARRSR